MNANDDGVVVIKPRLKDPDGLRRYLFSNYYWYGSSNLIVAHLERETGLKWIWLGCFMDTTCVATPDEVTKEYRIQLKEQSP